MKLLQKSIVLLVWLFAAGCSSTVDVAAKIGSVVGVATGVITPDQGESLQRAGGAVSMALERFTPENEYYIGRAVSAALFAQYKPLNKQHLNEYLNTLGQTLAAFSDKPETFGGYHFMALDSEEINAFAAPGGFVLITKGLLRCCRTEDALAAVIAHEISHIQLEHGLQAIKKSRVTTALTVLGAEGMKTFGGQDLANLTEAFEGSISDIVSTLVVNGYSRAQEFEADKNAVTILNRVGYNPAGLRDALEEMSKRLRPGGPGFAKTHPDPKLRIKQLEPLLSRVPSPSQHAARQRRFEKAVALSI